MATHEIEQGKGKPQDMENMALQKKLRTMLKPFVCKYCTLELSNMPRYLCHVRSHEKTIKAYWYNIQKTAVEEHHKCQYCEKRFKFPKKKHERVHTDMELKEQKPLKMLRPLICKYCRQQFGNVPRYLSHVRCHDRGIKTYWYCTQKASEAGATTENLIKESTVTNVSNVKHEMTHTGELPCKCRYCEKKFASADGKIKHEMTPASEKPHKCQYFEKSFNHAHGKTVHESRMHTEYRPYKCQYCEKRFIKTSEKKIHEMAHTGVKSHKCQYCEKSFNHDNGKKMHERRMHTGGRPYKCQYCEKRYFKSTEKKIHEMTHTGEKPHKCQYCEKGFNRADAKKIHEERKHTGKRSYKCQYCEKRFIISYDKKYHEMTHTGEKPYKCQYCEKRFVNSSHKKRHEKIHTGKPYQCQICEKRFMRAADKKKHDIACTGEKTYKYQHCEKILTSIRSKKSNEVIIHIHDSAVVKSP